MAIHAGFGCFRAAEVFPKLSLTFQNVIINDVKGPLPLKGRFFRRLKGSAGMLRPAMLTKGIGISGWDLLEVIRKAQDQSLLQEILEVEVNGNAMALEKLDAEIGSKAAVFFRLDEVPC
jgi:hypothetical protein